MANHSHKKNYKNDHANVLHGTINANKQPLFFKSVMHEEDISYLTTGKSNFY